MSYLLLPLVRLPRLGVVLKVEANRLVHHEGNRAFVGACQLIKLFQQRRVNAGGKPDLFLGFWERLSWHVRKRIGCKHDGNPEYNNNMIDSVLHFRVECQSQTPAASACRWYGGFESDGVPGPIAMGSRSRFRLRPVCQCLQLSAGQAAVAVCKRRTCGTIPESFERRNWVRAFSLFFAVVAPFVPFYGRVEATEGGTPSHGFAAAAWTATRRKC